MIKLENTPKLCPFCGSRSRDTIFTSKKVYACSNAECQASIAWMPRDEWEHRPMEQKLMAGWLMEESKRSSLQSRVDQLEHWIKEEGIRTDSCTFEILNKQCDGCRCHRFKEGK